MSAKISNGVPPLCLANMCCSEETLRFLINNGANVNERTDTGETTLHLAGRFESAEKMKLLLEHGADVNIKDENGKTALAWIGDKNCDAAKCFVKHLAKMKSEGAFIEEDAIQVIRENEPLLAHYKQCFGEMEFIKKTAFYNSYTLRNLLDENEKRLALLARNRYFVNAFKSINLAVLVPNFGREIATKFVKAVATKNLLDATEKYVALAFYHRLPDPVVRQIVKHLKPRDFPNLVESVLSSMQGVRKSARR